MSTHIKNLCGVGSGMQQGEEEDGEYAHCGQGLRNIPVLNTYQGTDRCLHENSNCAYY